MKPYYRSPSKRPSLVQTRTSTKGRNLHTLMTRTDITHIILVTENNEVECCIDTVLYIRKITGEVYPTLEYQFQNRKLNTEFIEQFLKTDCQAKKLFTYSMAFGPPLTKRIPLMFGIKSEYPKSVRLAKKFIKNYPKIAKFHTVTKDLITCPSTIGWVMWPLALKALTEYTQQLPPLSQSVLDN